MKVNTLIIGAGYVGRATYLQLKDVGDDVVIMDTGDPMGGTLNSGHLWGDNWSGGPTFRRARPDWWTGEHSSRAADYVIMEGSRPITVNVMGIKGTQLTEQRMVVANKLGAMIPVMSGDVEPAQIVTGYGVYEIRYDSGKLIQANRVVLACGSWNSQMVEAMGFAPLNTRAVRGRAYVYDTPTPINPTCVVSDERSYSVRQVAPYRVRIGDTYEDSTDSTGLRARGEIRRIADWMLRDASQVAEIDGYREVSHDGKFYVTTLAEDFIVAGGTDRFGFGAAGGIAHQVTKKLREAGACH